MYEEVLDNLDKISQSNDENLVRKIFMNYSKAHGLNNIVGKLIFKEAI